MFSAGQEAIVCSRVSEPAAAWFRESLALMRREPAQLAARWSGAGRRLGRAAIAPTAEEAAASPFPLDGWAVDELGRALLLDAALAGSPTGDHPVVVEELYRTGELREQQAVLKALPHLPDAARFAAIGIEAVRSNALSVIEAIACDNPFPAAFFPDAAFNQMVMKALFNALPLARVQGLDARRSPELVRMVSAWASERRAAGRPVPDDATRIMKE